MANVLLVEDNESFARDVAGALERQVRGRWTIVICRHGREAVARAGENDFSAALVDLGLPDSPGIEVIRRLAKAPRPVRCLAFTIMDDRSSVIGAAEAGAMGYVLKDEPVERLVELLEDCMNGRAPVSSGVAGYLLDACRSAQLGPAADGLLTAREREILTLIARGLSYRECADLLNIGLGTVQTHVKAVYRKLNVTNKAEAAAWAVQARLLR